MIQKGTKLKVLDNSGAKLVYCIAFKSGFKRRYAGIGDIIVVAVNQLRVKRRAYSKVKKGAVLHGLIVQAKVSKHITSSTNKVRFLQNSVVLLTRANKLIGTRVFGVLSKNLRYTRFVRILSLAKGFC